LSHSSCKSLTGKFNSLRYFGLRDSAAIKLLEKGNGENNNGIYLFLQRK